MDRPRYDGSEPCAGIYTELFYPETSGAWEIGPKLRALCSNCHLLNECAEYAIRHEAHGWWGGLSARERLQIRSSRGIVLQDPVIGAAYAS